MRAAGQQAADYGTKSSVTALALETDCDPWAENHHSLPFRGLESPLFLCNIHGC